MGEVYVSAQPNRKGDVVGGEDAIYNEDPIGPPILGFGFCSSQGRRNANEDRVFVRNRLNGKPELSFYGVFDGHAGDRAAEFCSKRIPALLCAALASPGGIDESKMQATLSQLYTDADREFCNEASANKWNDGCTACTAFISGRNLYCINTGDSKAVLCRMGKPIELTQDHKPILTSEQSRIKAAGGEVVMLDGVARVNGMISTSRALGDVQLKKFIIPDPDVTCRQIRKGDEFLIIGTDGLWDYVSTIQACSIAHQANNAKQAAVYLADYAMHNAGLDNVGVVVIDLRSLFSTAVNSSPQADIAWNFPQKVKAMADTVASKYDFSVIPAAASGWLQKESRGGVMGKRWQKRFFMLHAVSGDALFDSSVHKKVVPMIYVLHYHDSEEAAKKKNPRKPTFVDPAIGASREFHLDRPGRSCLSLFEISTGAPFILAAADDSDAESWVKELNATFARSGILPSSAPVSSNQAGEHLAGGVPQGLERTKLIQTRVRTLTGMAEDDPNALETPSANAGKTSMPTGLVERTADGGLTATGPLQLKQTETGGLTAIGGNWSMTAEHMAEMDIHCTVGIPKAGSVLSAGQCSALGVPAGSVVLA